MAGRDPKAAPGQMDRQTSELLAYVRQQNEEIDERQAELNAKLARLDAELRAARLRSGVDAGADLLGKTTASDEQDEQAVSTASRPSSAEPDPATSPFKPTAAEGGAGEFEEVERIVAQFTGDPGGAADDQPAAAESGIPNSDSSLDSTVPFTTPQTGTSTVAASRPEGDIPLAKSRFRRDAAHARVTHSERKQPTAEPAAASKPLDSFPEMLTKGHLSRLDSGVDIQAMATSLDASELESERRLLAERKIELDRRKGVLQRMQDETQALHREAIEMRLVTEQLWIELSQKAPADHVSELLSSLRSRLDEHYSAQQQLLDDRKQELIEMKQLIERKQEDIRDQSKKLQDWVETRHDEIKSYAAEVDAREMLLDRREHRMNEEFSKWEAQRSAYQNQLQSLLKKLNLGGLAGLAD